MGNIEYKSKCMAGQRWQPFLLRFFAFRPPIVGVQKQSTKVPDLLADLYYCGSTLMK